MAYDTYVRGKLKAKANSARTVYDPLNKMYRKVTRFFSGPMARYQTPQVANPNRVDDNPQNVHPIGHAIKRSDEYMNFNKMNQDRNVQVLRLERYTDFDEMEFLPMISTALDIYAGDVTTYTEFSPLLKIVTPNDEIKEVLETLYFKTLGIELNLFSWVRSLCKYGDHFMFLDFDEENGITRAVSLPAIEIERLENQDETNPNFIQFQWNRNGMTFNYPEIAHFRILGDDRFAPYGMSVLDGARRAYREYQLMFDNMIAYRVVRAPERRVFKIDVGGIEPDKVDAYMEQVITKLKRETIQDPSTGRINLRSGAASIENDYYLPVRKGTETSIDPIAGGQITNAIDDVKLIKDEMFMALKIPPSYYSGDAIEDEAALAQKSVIFARLALRIQQSVVAELLKIGRLHLMMLGYESSELFNFELKLNNPSRIAEMQELEQMKTRTAVASSLSDSYFSRYHIWKNIYSLNDEQIKRMRMEIIGDAKFNVMLSMIESSLGEGGDMGGGAPAGGMGGGLEALPPPTGQEDAMPQEPSSLLVTPEAGPGGGEQGRRMDSLTAGVGKPPATAGAKGKIYNRVGADGRASGQRRNHFQSLAGRSTSRATSTNLFPGMSTMSSVARGIYDSLQEPLAQISDEEILLMTESTVVETERILAENTIITDTRTKLKFSMK